MSSHFSANQYESAFSPQRLQNYQVPLRHKQHPSLRSGCTRIISNNGGHLNFDVPRSPVSPWGSFVGTWQAERRPIQLKTRTKLMTHLSQIDQQNAEGSRRSSRATSARVSQASQRATSPRPQSAMESERGDRESKTVAPDSHNNETGNQGGSKPPTPATETGSKPAMEIGSKPPTPATNAGSKPHTPATEASSKPSTAATEIGSKPPTPASASKPPTPAPGSPVHPQPGPRATSAVSSRTSTLSLRSRTTASRVQSATVVRGTPRPKAPLPDSSVPSRVSSAALSCGAEGTRSPPLPSTRASPPQPPNTTKIEPDTST